MNAHTMTGTSRYMDREETIEFICYEFDFYSESKDITFADEIVSIILLL
jgi:hypothetical protein